MFGGPPVQDEPSEIADPVGEYRLVNDMALIAEKLFAQPGEVMDLNMQCPADGGRLLGKANKYARSVTIWCSDCTFRINR